MEQQEWEVTEGVCTTPGAEGVRVYGVAVRCGDGSLWAWPDVDTDRAVVCRLAARLQRAQPERCHFDAMVADFIEEIAGSAK